MPDILRFRSTWGKTAGPNFENFKKWFLELKAQGYAGVEVNAYESEWRDRLPELRQVIEGAGLKANALVFSAWPDYEGPRPANLGVKEHLAAYRDQLKLAKQLEPVKINCQSGADHFTLDQTLEFYRGTLVIDAELNLQGKVCHETHRNRSLFNPYTTYHVVTHVPEIRITADISHHVVCCERFLGVNEDDILLYQKIIPHIHHIHARIGTTQSSQCPDPTNEVFRAEREFCERHWVQVIEAHIKVYGAYTPITFVPEYGPYPYHPFDATRDFSEVADTEGKRLQSLFEKVAYRFTP